MNRLVTCHGKPDCVRLGAMLPASQRFPKGEPYLVGRYVESVKCARCGVRQRVTPADFRRFPPVTEEGAARLAREYRVPAIATLPVVDLVGAGLKPREAWDMQRSGFTRVAELEALERPKDDVPPPKEEKPADPVKPKKKRVTPKPKVKP